MGYNLFLDDNRTPINVFYYTKNPMYIKESWVIVRNYDEFISYIQENGLPEKISFDHDLGDEHYKNQNNINYDNFLEKSGYDCAKWLINYCIDNKKNLPSIILIHSMNIVGTKNIESLFNSYYKIYNK